MAPGAWRTDAKIGWRNLWRNPGRTALTWLAIAVAQFTLVWMASFLNGYETLIFQVLTGPLLGHVQIHAPKYLDDNAVERTVPHAVALLREVKARPHVVRVSARAYGPVLAAAEELGHVATVVGLDIAGESEGAGLLEGLPPGQRPGPNEALVGKGLANEMGVHAGQTLALMGQAADGSVASGLYRIKAVVRIAAERINRTGIVMELGAAQDFLALHDQVHEVAVRADPPAAIPDIVESLRADPALTHLDIADWRTLAPQIATLLEAFGTINLIILVLVFAATVAGIANTMLIATFERGHEFGMLLALGCRPARLIAILLIESLLLGIAGVAIGSLLGGSVVAYEMRHGIDLSALAGESRDAVISSEFGNIPLLIVPILKGATLVQGVAAVVVTSVVACLWPARRVSRMHPVEAMRA